jgi:hypothetical protein
MLRYFICAAQVVRFWRRFWSKVRRTKGGCWLWLASTDQGGYGKVKVGRDAEGHQIYVGAHRAAYELTLGPIPRRRVLDHLCRRRRCVNPDHLEPVTVRTNTIRGFKARKAARP